jgi:DNA-binding response OmpR family regulator
MLRERWTGAELPIIMVTCLSQESAVVEGLEAGANDFMSKPIR